MRFDDTDNLPTWSACKQCASTRQTLGDKHPPATLLIQPEADGLHYRANAIPPPFSSLTLHAGALLFEYKDLGIAGSRLFRDPPATLRTYTLITESTMMTAQTRLCSIGSIWQ